MARQISWGVSIARHDGSKLRYTERGDRVPTMGQIFKMTDADGTTLEMVVESVDREANEFGAGIYRVNAREI